MSELLIHVMMCWALGNVLSWVRSVTRRRRAGHKPRLYPQGLRDATTGEITYELWDWHAGWGRAVLPAGYRSDPPCHANAQPNWSRNVPDSGRPGWRLS